MLNNRSHDKAQELWITTRSGSPLSDDPLLSRGLVSPQHLLIKDISIFGNHFDACESVRHESYIQAMFSKGPQLLNYMRSRAL